MKKGIAIAVIAGILVGGGMLLAGKNPGDAEKVAEVLKDMTAADLNGTPAASTVNGPPDLSDEVIAAVLEMLKNPEAHGGLLEIAHRHGCSMSQVKIIMAGKRKKLQELAEAHAEPI